MDKPEADNALRQAIQAHAEAYGLQRGDEHLSEYAVVAAWDKVEQDGVTHYTVHYHVPIIPTHTAAGLFTVALDLVMNGEPE